MPPKRTQNASATPLARHDSKSDGRQRSSGPVRAAGGLVLRPTGGPKKAARPHSRSSADAGPGTVSRANGSLLQRRQSPSIVAGILIEVVEDFTSGEKELPVGKIGGAKLSRGQRGKVMSIDDDGDALVGFRALGKTVLVYKSQFEHLRPSAPPVERPPESPEDMRAFDALLEKQQSTLPRILSELRTHKGKRSCWAWWVFPTEKAGDSDPACTRVTRSNAAVLLSNASTAKHWQQVLEALCDLIEERGMSVLPSIDHGRVHWFIKFWAALETSPEWMQAVCGRLDQFPWPPS